MAGVSLKHICKTYPNGFEAVKDFNLEIKDKEFLIFVGAIRMRKVHDTSYDRRFGGDYFRRIENWRYGC